MAHQMPADSEDATTMPARTCTNCGEVFHMVRSARHHQHEADHDTDIEQIEVSL